MKIEDKFDAYLAILLAVVILLFLYNYHCQEERIDTIDECLMDIDQRLTALEQRSDTTGLYFDVE
ncbi:MAG: hypothetical protein Q4Q25_04305 [Methanocorpusculum sp.]|nr:hypothetical protein [Methanocorpusculum sp.]